ncbi:hypothetical protein CFC21_085874 [Triticum aestivum]|uniref:NB-ARC domain-containing protein n=2 Tax=Triticum aestivum TaxID=4565 RepID=A0A9R1L932_WHEAT|nr:hypothetical protein CFC21_085874 [Triticum aestivum]
MLNDTRGALWWSYQLLNPDIRRCFEFCNIFPRRSGFSRQELVRLWIAGGFVKTSCSEKDMEDVAEDYIQELLSCSFLQPVVDGSFGCDFTIHDLLHDLLDKVTGSDYFRIENETSQRGNKSWKGDIPQDVRHLFIRIYGGELITDKILGLENLRTLILYYGGKDTTVDEKFIECICKMLPNLRVLAIDLSWANTGPNFSLPESISQLKHLRYLSFIAYSCMVILPIALAKLHHIQMLDFVDCEFLGFGSTGLINLRHLFLRTKVKCPNIGRLVSLQTVPTFEVRNEQGYEVKQVSDLNKLRGRLEISGLENVTSKEEALEANLAAKEGLTYFKLKWHGGDDSTRCSPEVEAEVLEGLRHPVGLEVLDIEHFKGSSYPDWMLSAQNGERKDPQLHTLRFSFCGPRGPGPELAAFPCLRVLVLYDCIWDALPDNLEQLKSLKLLIIHHCVNIKALPTLPHSLEEFCVNYGDAEFRKNCQTVGHPCWLKIKHIPKKEFAPTYISWDELRSRAPCSQFI